MLLPWTRGKMLWPLQHLARLSMHRQLGEDARRSARSSWTPRSFLPFAMRSKPKCRTGCATQSLRQRRKECQPECSFRCAGCCDFLFKGARILNWLSFDGHSQSPSSQYLLRLGGECTHARAQRTRDSGVPSRGRHRIGAQRACRARSRALGGSQVAAVSACGSETPCTQRAWSVVEVLLRHVLSSGGLLPLWHRAFGSSRAKTGGSRASVSFISTKAGWRPENTLTICNSSSSGALGKTLTSSPVECAFVRNFRTNSGEIFVWISTSTHRRSSRCSALRALDTTRG